MPFGAGRILVVGRNSFLARHFLAIMPRERVRAISHDEIDAPDLFDEVTCVINFARHPQIASVDYDPEAMDPDLRLAARLRERDIAYLMLSTRKVYAPATGPLAETSPLGPTDAYGANKLVVEEHLQARLGERLTILRLANVFGYEREPGRRTFLSMLLDRLARKDEIRFDMSPFVERDFLPVEVCARLLARIAERPPGGSLNLGSGIGLPTGRLALWILQGHGRGRLVIDSPEEKDPFVLDVGRLRALFGEPCTYDDLRRACLAIGERLRSGT